MPHVALAAFLSTVGCLPAPAPASGDRSGHSQPVDDGVGSSPQGSGDPAPSAPFAIVGVYRGTQSWQLGDLLTLEEGDGQAVAAAAVAEIVELTGLPSFLRDDAEDLLADMVGDAIASYVDGAALDSPLLSELAAIVGDVEVGVELAIESQEGASIAGREQLRSVTLRYGDRSAEVPLSALLVATSYDTATSDVSGTLSAGRDTLDVALHPYVLRPDAILSVAGIELLDFDTFEAALASIIDCGDFVAVLTGGGAELRFSLAGYDLALSAEELLPVCELAKAELVDGLVGYFEMDTGIATGGVLGLTAQSGVVVGLEGHDYRGQLSVGPVPLGFDVGYSAERVQ